MKKVLKVVGIIILAVVILLAVLFIKNIIDSNKPYISGTYYNDFKSSSPLEQKYAGLVPIPYQQLNTNLTTRASKKSLSGIHPSLKVQIRTGR